MVRGASHEFLVSSAIVLNVAHSHRSPPGRDASPNTQTAVSQSERLDHNNMSSSPVVSSDESVCCLCMPPRVGVMLSAAAGVVGAILNLKLYGLDEVCKVSIG